MVKVQGKEILWYTINFLKINNFNHFILPLGYRANLIKRFLKKNGFFNSKIETIQTGLNSNIGKRLNILNLTHHNPIMLEYSKWEYFSLGYL